MAQAQAQHTPGPWKASHDGLKVFNPEGPLTFVIAEMNTKVCSTAPFLAEQAANARLIAAAPELLAALEIAYRHIDMNALRISHCKDAAAIEAAIARAAP